MPKPPGLPFLPGSSAEWTGLFLFGVGVFGALQHSVMRHVRLFGYLPADWFYLALLGAGGGLMIAAAPWNPDKDQAPAGWQGHLVLAARIVAAVLLFSFVVWRIAVYR